LWERSLPTNLTENAFAYSVIETSDFDGIYIGAAFAGQQDGDIYVVKIRDDGIID